MSLACLLAVALAAQQDSVTVATFPFTAQAAIDESDPVDSREGDPFDQYALQLSAGTRYRITATPSGATTSLMLHIYRPGEMYAFATDLAFRPNEAATLTFGPEQTGTFNLRVMSIIGRRGYPDSAPYTLSVVPLAANALPLAPAPASTRPATWRVWEGTFTAGDPDDAEGRRFQEYRIRMEGGHTLFVVAGQVPPVAMDAERGGLSLVIRAADQPGDTYEPLGRGWESGAGPAAATVRPPRTGDYIIRVSGPPARALVRYRLSVGE